MNNKIFLLLAIILVATFYFPNVYSYEELTLEKFLTDMKINPQNYYILINRTDVEIEYYKSHGFGNFIDYFNLNISHYFLDDGRNFILLEIPTTQEGLRWAPQRKNSYVEVFENRFLDYQPYEYYLSNNWSMFNYAVIFSTVQPFFFDKNNLEEAYDEYALLDSNNDYNISEIEVSMYSLNKFTNRILEYSANPIYTDYLTFYKNEAIELKFGERDYCPGFNETSIFVRGNYTNNNFASYSFEYMQDKCNEAGFLEELKCSSLGVVYESVKCPSQTICLDGACRILNLLQTKDGPVTKMIVNIASKREKMDFSVSFKSLFNNFGNILN